jgi:hypothetical protein
LELGLIKKITRRLKEKGDRSKGDTQTTYKQLPPWRLKGSRSLPLEIETKSRNMNISSVSHKIGGKIESHQHPFIYNTKKDKGPQIY